MKTLTAFLLVGAIAASAIASQPKRKHKTVKAPGVAEPAMLLPDERDPNVKPQNLQPIKPKAAKRSKKAAAGGHSHHASR